DGFNTLFGLTEFSDLQHLSEPLGKSLFQGVIQDRRAKDFVASGSAAVVEWGYKDLPGCRQQRKCDFAD
ncbi:hypothetical protein, partial [Pinisolibacter sp.]|uniref:hypothetical protein n=1 Tax=Pinisolibacter sp. TaxID=2172024 RepID=UPI002FDE4080